MDTEVIVIGGGPAGAATAIELARRGRRVVRSSCAFVEQLWRRPKTSLPFDEEARRGVRSSLQAGEKCRVEP